MREISKAENLFTPEAARYRSERLDVLDEFYWKLIDKKKIQCAMYAMARDSKVFVTKGMGKLHYDENDTRLCQHNSIRRIASISKLFTATAIMKLVEDGVLDVMQTVKGILKEFDTDVHRTITISHLLNHTSGINADGGVYPDPYGIWWWDIACNKETELNWIEAALMKPLRAKIGTEWCYSSTGYTILGEIIARVTGSKAEDWIMDNIINPLGMTDTHFDLPKEKWDRVVAVDDWSDPYKCEEMEKKYFEKLKMNGGKQIEVPNTYGGIFSTAHDLLIFAQMLLNKGIYNDVRILSRKTVELMAMDCSHGAKNFCWGSPGDIKHYGLGTDLYGLNRLGLNSPGSYGHEGAGRCALYLDPQENFVTVFFVPSITGWDPETIVNVSNVIWSGLV